MIKYAFISPMKLKETNGMAIIKYDDLVRMVSKYSGFKKSVVDEVLYGQIRIIKKCMLQGHTIKLRDLGGFKLQEKPAKPGREMKIPYTGEIKWIDPKPEYQKPFFKFYPEFEKEVRKKSEGNLL